MMCDALLSLISSLKLIDEAIEFELIHLAERGSYGRGRENDLGLCLSEDELGQGGVETAQKCYESDMELNVSQKKLRGAKKKQLIVALDRVTRSNKIYSWY